MTENLTHDTLPQGVTQLIKEVSELKSLLIQKQVQDTHQKQKTDIFEFLKAVKHLNTISNKLLLQLVYKFDIQPELLAVLIEAYQLESYFLRKLDHYSNHGHIDIITKNLEQQLIHDSLLSEFNFLINL